MGRRAGFIAAAPYYKAPPIRTVSAPRSASPPRKRGVSIRLPRGAGGAVIGGIGSAAWRAYRNKRKKRPTLFTNVRTGEGSTKSFYKCYSKMSRVTAMALKTGQPNYDSILSSSRLASAYGKQGMQELYFNSRTDYTRYCTNIGITTAQAATSKLYVGQTKVQCTYTNQDISTAYLHIYEVEPRFHMPTATFGMMNLWDTGLDDEVGTANTYFQDVYQKPFQSQEFCLHYNVKKVFCIELAQGQSHKHTSVYNINNPVYGSLVNNYLYTRGFTKCQLLVVSGTPLNDSTNVNAVSTSTIAVDVVTKIDTNYTYIEDKTTNYFYQNSLSTITTGRTISIGAGAVANESEA